MNTIFCRPATMTHVFSFWANGASDVLNLLWWICSVRFTDPSFFLWRQDVGARVCYESEALWSEKPYTLIRFRKSSLCDSCFFLACQEIHDAMTRWIGCIFQLRSSGIQKVWFLTLCEDGMPPVYESAVCVEYIDELASRDRSGGHFFHTLMPGSPAERAALRLKVDWINKSLWWSSTVFGCTSPFFWFAHAQSFRKFRRALKRPLILRFI